jgi:multiple sugar transport system ATP-binding protein
MATVSLQHIYKFYGNYGAVEDVSLDIRDGEFVTLLGPSGCGKTTILRMIAGLENVDKGGLYVGGANYTPLPPQKRNVAMVFQNYALFPHLNVRTNVLFGLRIRKSPKQTMKEKLRWALSTLSLEGLEQRLPKELSGGQRQRVALARALVLDPAVLLLDEPLSNLDAALKEDAMEELRRVHRRVGKTIIFVTHNQVEAMKMSDRIALIRNGRLEQYDDVNRTYDFPGTLFTARFLGSPRMNTFRGVITRQADAVGVDSEVGFLLLDAQRAQQAEASLGREVVVGIRPQNIHFRETGADRRQSDSRLQMCVDIIEELGDRRLVVGQCGDTTLRLLVSREAQVAREQNIGAFVDGRRLHVFDYKSERNIFAAA